MARRSTVGLLVTTLALAELAAAPSAPAQIVLFEAYGEQSGDSLGLAFDGAGDVDADGRGDLVISRPKGLGVDGIYYGYVTVYSGLDGSVIWELECPFASSVAGAGDVDGDGHDDIVTGSAAYDLVGQNSGLVQVYSGADASLIWQFFGDASGLVLGRVVARIGDTNGDGRPDILASAPNGGGQGRVYLWSGADGSNLLTLQWPEGTSWGAVLDGAGDVDGDGAGDFIVGFDSASADKALVYSGADGSVLLQLDKPYPEAAYWANAVGGAGDVDGDGHADLIVGARGDTTFFPNGGMACVLSGADGSVLHTFYGWGDQHLMGYSVDGAGDVDGDGTPDLLVGSPGTPQPGGSDVGQLLVYSGSDGGLIRQFSPDWLDSGDSLGRAVKGLGDLNADGFDDFGGGAPNVDVGGDNAGALLVVTLRHYITDVEPDEVIFSAPTQVSIIGGGFTDDAPITIEFGGLPATDVTYVSESRIDCTTPVGAENSLVGVSLTQHGLTSEDDGVLTFGGAHIDSLWPPNGSMLGEEEVLLSGRNFVDDGSVQVTFGHSLATVLAVYEPDAILVRTPFMGSDQGVAVKVTSSAGTHQKNSAYKFDDRWITPKSAPIAGGTIITMQGDVFPTTLADTQAWIGGIPAEVAAVTPTGFDIVVPAVDVAPDQWLDVRVLNSNGNQQVTGSFHYTPSLDLTTQGSPFLGYDLAGHAGVNAAEGPAPKLTLWLIDPTQTAPDMLHGRPQAQTPGAGSAASGGGASAGTAPATGSSSPLPYSPPAGPAGSLKGKPLAIVLAAVPLSIEYANWDVDIGALDPFLIGTTLSFQGLVTGDGSPHGSLTNVMSFVVE